MRCGRSCGTGDERVRTDNKNRLLDVSSGYEPDRRLKAVGQKEDLEGAIGVGSPTFSLKPPAGATPTTDHRGLTRIAPPQPTRNVEEPNSYDAGW